MLITEARLKGASSTIRQHNKQACNVTYCGTKSYFKTAESQNKNSYVIRFVYVGKLDVIAVTTLARYVTTSLCRCPHATLQ